MTREQLIDRLLTKIPDDEIDTTMRWIDEYVSSCTDQPVEVWTADEVREFIGAKNRATARATLSRWGIESTGTRDRLAVYPAEAVRRACFGKSAKEIV